MGRWGRTAWLRRRHPGAPPRPGKGTVRPGDFSWPDGATAALCLTFDDGRASQLSQAVPALDGLGLRATFFVLPDAVASNRPAWRRVAASGHEIGNHTVNHPCPTGIPGARSRVLEDMTLVDMRAELVDANARIEALLGVVPRTFAYPCGQSAVGRGLGTRTYVPLVAELFEVGRTFNDRWANEPRRCDLSRVACVNMDELGFGAIRPMLEDAVASGSWLVLGGHEVGPAGTQTTAVGLLEQISSWCDANRVWVATMASVGAWVRSSRTSLGAGTGAEQRTDATPVARGH
jgi:peptidoglycan/xylan/chitin deacetylase (PgdA/CDA1 family)